MDEARSVTELLARLKQGDRGVEEELLNRLYPELRRLAQYNLNRERPGHTLQATALVNEVYIRVFGGQEVDWQDRAHFLALVARKMRQVLVDHARAHAAEKRGAGWVKISLDQAAEVPGEAGEDLLDLDRALSRLQELDPQAAHAVELRFFGGLTEKETAEAMGVTPSKVKHTMEFARAWLFRELRGASAG